MKEVPNRPIEMGVALDSGTWETCIVEIPADTAEADIFRVAQDILIGLPNNSAREVNITGTWVVSSMDDECPEVEVPERLGVVVVLEFDANQTTVGSEKEQQVAAVDQINLALQREPYGLGANINIILE